MEGKGLTGPKRSSYGAPVLSLMDRALSWYTTSAYIMTPNAMLSVFPSYLYF